MKRVLLIIISLMSIITSVNSREPLILPTYFDEQIKKAIFDSREDVEVIVKTKDLPMIEDTLKSKGYFYTKIMSEYTTSIFIHIQSNLNIDLINKYKLQVDRKVMMDEIKSCNLYKEDKDLFLKLVNIPSVNSNLNYSIIKDSQKKINYYCHKKLNRTKYFMSKMDFFKIIIKNPDYYLE